MKEASGKRGRVRDVELTDIGEDNLIAELTRSLRLDSRVKIGPGDDCAVVKFGKRWQLLKTDCIVESIHFSKESPATWVGWKALCRAISDVAAMGGRPMDALVTIAVAPQVRLRWLRGVYSGLRKAAQRYDVNLVGGETSRSPGPAFISVALTGIVEKRRALLRSGGKPGDFLYVTGQLGGSIRGKHLRFEPRLAEALWLADHFAINAMIDLSDGLGSDLPRLAKASSTGFEIDRERLPLSKGCSIEQAISDGEDYELLFAVPPEVVPTLEERWDKKFPTLALTQIGRLTEPNRQELSASGFNQLTDSGYDHFPLTKNK
ncbi:MAG TPA: thiamine-phosphate kinase [Chthoniobacterales bacterium]|nr:thiamine-phosphate kinase [Chthoniobacterales bacterium]